MDTEVVSTKKDLIDMLDRIGSGIAATGNGFNLPLLAVGVRNA